MRLTKISVSNCLGARNVQIALDHPVSLIAGTNASGKSSIGEAVRMALTGETVRVALKKEYGSLVTEGQDVGFATVTLDDGQAAMTLPNGTHEVTSAQVKTRECALPYVLDSQRFARLAEQERRAFLFGLTGLSAGSAEVKNKLLARGCDAAKVEAVLPLLRAGASA